MKIAVVGEKLSNISGDRNDSLGCLRWLRHWYFQGSIDQHSSVFKHLLGDQSDASVSWRVNLLEHFVSSRTQYGWVRRLGITNVMQNKIIYNNISVVVSPAAKIIFWRIKSKHLVICESVCLFSGEKNLSWRLYFIIELIINLFCIESCNLFFVFRKIGTLYCPYRGKYSVETEGRKAGLSRRNRDSWQPYTPLIFDYYRIIT